MRVSGFVALFLAFLTGYLLWLHYTNPMRRLQMIENGEILQTYSLEQLSRTYHSYFDKTDIKCRKTFRMGSSGDAGWDICDDPEWRPLQPCTVYSFGKRQDFYFDEDIARVYDCHVFSFDPSMKPESYHAAYPDLMEFRNIGIGGKMKNNTVTAPSGEKLHSFSAIKEMLHHTAAVIDVVKLEVDFDEWITLSAMIEEGQLYKVRQLAVEFHRKREDEDLRDLMVSSLAVLRGLQEMGFLKYLSLMKGECARKALGYDDVTRTSCYKVCFVNVNLKQG